MPKWLRKWWWVPLVLFAVGDVVFHLSPSPGGRREGAEWKQQLEAAAQGADRLVVDRNTWSDDPPDIAVELSGSGKVREFLDQIQIRSSREHCMCTGNLVFRFYKGEQELTSVTYHHGERIRWNDGDWNGDGILTRGSRSALAAWLVRNGYAAPAAQ